MRITGKDGVVTFAVRVQPRASRDEIAGEYQEGLRVRLTAPPVGDRANEALRRFLASKLKVSLVAVRIASGERSRTKRVEIRGVSLEQVEALGEDSRCQISKPSSPPFASRSWTPGSSTTSCAATRSPTASLASTMSWPNAAGFI